MTELLENHFRDIVDLQFTAHMENQLDSIATKEKSGMNFERVLRHFQNRARWRID